MSVNDETLGEAKKQRSGAGKDRYLKSSSMIALAKSMNLAASVLGFDIIELWSSEDRRESSTIDSYHCTYVYASPEILGTYPDVIVGHWPEHKRKHTVSPQLCQCALESASGYYWHTLIDGEQQIEALKSSAQTEVAYLLQGEEIPLHVFIVGFAVNRIEFLHSKINFLSGIGYAIYVAAFVDGAEEHAAVVDSTLDEVTKDIPRRPSRSVLLNGQERMSMDVVESYREMSDYENFKLLNEFAFPLEQLPRTKPALINMSIEQVKEITHFADGSNSNIYSGTLDKRLIVVKMIKKTAKNDPVAVHEFKCEEGILSVVSHPNIITFMGSGTTPRMFLALEHLGGGTLTSLMSKNQSRFTQGLFRQPTFTYAEILKRARDIAEALDYLHTRVHPDVTIIHRDLKPDNVGFTSEGTLKLLDLGLSACVKRRLDIHVAYEMTGNTGSLRYMAPEVALRKAYNEKVDVYSFGIMVWQMASDTVPFKGMTREQFMQEVVQKRLRPKLDVSWPIGFCNLLTTCWHHESISRPSFSTVIIDLNALIDELQGRAWPRRGKSIRRTIGDALPQLSTTAEESGSRQSSWF